MAKPTGPAAPAAHMASTAPYAAAAPVDRPLLDPQPPWREAGRSHLSAAAAIAAEHRRLRGPIGRWRTPNRVRALRARAKAAEITAQLLDPLRATGWVILHDRHIAGTSATLDHVLVGPPGLAIVQNRVTQSTGRDRDGLPLADRLPLAPEREQTRWAMAETLTRCADALEAGWYLYAYPFVVLHTETGSP